MSAIHLFKVNVLFEGSYLCSLSLFRSVFFLPRKYSALISLALDYTTLLYIINELPLCLECLFVTVCSRWCFQKRTKLSFKMIMKKRWPAYKIWKDHSLKNWTYISVITLLKCLKDSGPMNRKEGSGRPMLVTIEENTDLIEELIC